MHVVAVIFGMPADKRIQIIYWNPFRPQIFKRDGISRGDAFIRCLAVIVRRHRLYFLLRWLARGRCEQRLVVSVDQHGEVNTLAAEPIRW